MILVVQEASTNQNLELFVRCNQCNQCYSGLALKRHPFGMTHFITGNFLNAHYIV